MRNRNCGNCVWRINRQCTLNISPAYGLYLDDHEVCDHQTLEEELTDEEIDIILSGQETDED